jgi:hypothetical protein
LGRDQSREIPITHDTDVGFASGNVYIIERNFGTTNFKRYSNDEFVSDVPTLCDRKYCVFATIGKKLYAIGGQHKLARNSIEVFNGKRWKLLNHKLCAEGACNDTQTIGTTIYIAKGHCYNELCSRCTYCDYIEVYDTITNTLAGLDLTEIKSNTSRFINNLSYRNETLFKIMVFENELFCMCENNNDGRIMAHYVNSGKLNIDLSYRNIGSSCDCSCGIIKISYNAYIEYKKDSESNILDYLADGFNIMRKCNMVADYYPQDDLP